MQTQGRTCVRKFMDTKNKAIFKNPLKSLSVVKIFQGHRKNISAGPGISITKTILNISYVPTKVYIVHTLLFTFM